MHGGKVMFNGTFVLWFAASGCVPDFDAPRPGPSDTDSPTVPVDPAITEGPTIEPGACPDVAFVQMLTVSTNVPTFLTVLLEADTGNREISFPTARTEHEEPLLGLVEGTQYTATVTLTTVDEVVLEAAPATFYSGVPLDVPAPNREQLIDDPYVPRLEPGYTIYPAEAPNTGIVLLEAVDALGRRVWQYVPPVGVSMVAAQFHPSDGTVSVLVGGRTIRRLDFACRNVQSWSPADDVISGDTPVDVPGFHHEAVFEEDGSFWSLYKSEDGVVELNYPLDEYDLTDRGEATLDTDVVVHVAADGTVLGRWPLENFLDTQRIGFNATDPGGPNDTKLAWSHANAVVPLGNEVFLVSSRHQDAVVKIDGAANGGAGEAVWILANHDGWRPEFTDLLLEPVGTPFQWFTHQHAPSVDSAGRVLLFDNGNCAHENPYMAGADCAGPLFSRLVRYDIDETLKTVTQSFSFVADPGPNPLYASLLGNLDEMPITGNLLGTFAFLKQEGGVENGDVGLGENSVRIIEVDPDQGTLGAAVWDLRLSGPVGISARGWQTDRAIRAPSLYPSDVVVTELP